MRGKLALPSRVPVYAYICKYVHVSVWWGNTALSLKGPKDSIKLPGLGQRQVRDAWEMLLLFHLEVKGNLV